MGIPLTHAFVPLQKAEPGGSARARAPAPQGSADDPNLSQVDTHLNWLPEARA